MKTGCSLTLAIITLNEVDRVAGAMESVPFADEVLILDSGSTDGTIELAKDLGAKVICTDWPGHREQKNRALSTASGDLILSLDADERLCPIAQQSLLEALSSPPKAYSVNRCSVWQGREIRRGLWYPDRKLRVVPNGRGRWVGDNPHDQLIADYHCSHLNGDILHFPYRSLSEHLKTIETYSAISARSLHRRGVRGAPYSAVLHSSWHFTHSFVVRRGFLEGGHGLALAGLGAAQTYLKWKKLCNLS